MSVWSKKDSFVDSPGMFGYFMTVVSFAFAVLIAVVLTPFVNFYLYTNSFPDSDQRQQIYNDLKSDGWGVVLSSVVGLTLTLAVMFTMKFGRYIALVIVLLEQIIIGSCLSLLSTWLIWKYNTTTNSTLLTMIPFMVTQFAAYISIQLMAIFGQGGRILYNFVALGGILGAFVGVSRSIQQNYFYFGGADPLVWDVALGVAFGQSILDTVFFFGSCSLAAVCIARSKAGGTVLWYIPAFVLPIGFACTFSLYVELADYVPVISSTASRYIVGVLVALAVNVLSAVFFYSIKKEGQVAVRFRNKDELFSANTSAGGPIAANAILIV